MFLSFYFKPDLSAGSFRASALADELSKLLSHGDALDIVTTTPNRYSTFAQEAAEYETNGPVTIRRIVLPPHRSDLWGQSRAFLHFARGANRLTASSPYDLVIATSSRLMTATLGAWIARRTGSRLYLDIRDIFVDTIGDVFPKVAAWVKLPLSIIERWTMRRADRINLVSHGFESYFRDRYPDRSYTWFTNGIDDEFLHSEWPIEQDSSGHRPLLVLYAGNIGEGQGLHIVLPELAARLQGRVSFQLIGDGGRRDLLLDGLRRAGVRNVEVLPPRLRPQLLEAYRKADILFLHLNAHPAFEKVLPSKIFEYAATGKPIWAGVAGYAARFITTEVSNAAVFPPSNVAEAIKALNTLTLHAKPRPEFVARYARRRIVEAMAKNIIALARPDST